jgi:hypothetical protein
MFAATMAPGIDLLSLVRITVGMVISMERAPRKLQNEDIRPVMKSARWEGSTDREHACSSASIPVALKYLFSVAREAAFLQHL